MKSQIINYLVEVYGYDPVSAERIYDGFKMEFDMKMNYLVDAVQANNLTSFCSLLSELNAKALYVGFVEVCKCIEMVRPAMKKSEALEILKRLRQLRTIL